ncbi:MAG TPA: hypothetical protein VFW65_08035 [Pseudonocardiaceae bacterium]|nr:hypothetical protein [Pseudonocardiaceae bacterium]
MRRHTVEAIMTTPAITVGVSTDITSAARLLATSARRRYRRFQTPW